MKPSTRAHELLKSTPVNYINWLLALDPDQPVRVYSYQGEDAMAGLKQCGYLTGQSKYVESPDHYWTKPYAWMRAQMSERVPDFSGDYPVWAWIKRPSTKPKPRRYTGTKEDFRVTALVPRRRILFSDYTDWHMPLNNGPCTRTEAEHDEFTGDDDAIMATWPQIFTFEPSRTVEERYWHGANNRFIVQACIDRIYENEIVGVRELPAL